MGNNAFEPDNVIICALTSEKCVKGSVERACARCFEGIWVSPTSLDAIKGMEAIEETWETLCARCAHVLTQDDEETPLRLAPGALSELAKEFGSNIKDLLSDKNKARVLAEIAKYGEDGVLIDELSHDDILVAGYMTVDNQVELVSGGGKELYKIRVRKNETS